MTPHAKPHVNGPPPGPSIWGKLHLALVSHFTALQHSWAIASMERRGFAVCHECMSLLRQPKRNAHLRLTTPIARQWIQRSFITTKSPMNRTLRERDVRQRVQDQPRRPYASKSIQKIDSKEINARVLELSASATRVEDNKLPTEQRILYVLEQLESIAHNILDSKGTPRARTNGRKAQRDSSATSALLGSVNARRASTNLSNDELLNLISQEAESILRHPNVFITASILKTYVQLQTLLHQPSSFPDIFALYASKPIPTISRSGTIELAPAPSPDKINSAIPTETANLALTAAITSHDLALCIDIINTTFATPAFKKAKILRRCALPASGLALAPVTAYALATQFSLLQTSMDPQYATSVAFAGIMTYIGTVGGLGYIVVTTANDQMDRVTWSRGVPLWERWVREEERAAFDRVAGRWGFQDVRRRGEEEGVDWDVLREVVGLRGMGLDRVELMEGME